MVYVKKILAFCKVGDNRSLLIKKDKRYYLSYRGNQNN